MKAILEIVTCTSDHIDFVALTAPDDYDKQDEWDFCNDNFRHALDCAGIDGPRCCPQCGDTDTRVQFVEWCDDNDWVDRIIALRRAKRRATDIDRRLVRSVSYGVTANELVAALCKEFPGLVDCETDVNGADLVDWLTSNLSKD